MAYSGYSGYSDDDDDDDDDCSGSSGGYSDELDMSRFRNIKDVLDSRRATDLLTDAVGYGGDEIDTFRVGRSVYECSETPAESTYDFRFLGSAYGSENDKSYRFIPVEYDDAFMEYVSLKSSKQLEKDARNEKRRNTHDIHLHVGYNRDGDRDRLTEEARQTLLEYADPACFGDVLKEETRIDDKVRKGKDIELTPLIEKNVVKIGATFLEYLERKFYEFSGIRSVEAKPYKINYYAKGDHFTMHRDSPEDGLVGTIVFHLHGDYNCLTIGPDRKEWTVRDGPILMFYPETDHCVNPVPNERWTMTFKVVRKDLEQMRLTPSLTRLGNRIDFTREFGILLQHGYSYIGVKTVHDLLRCLKGKDLKIYQDLHALLDAQTHTLNLVPVLVDDEDGKDDCANYDESERTSYIKPRRKKFTGTRSDIADAISVHNVPSEFLQIINANLDAHAGETSTAPSAGAASAGAASAAASTTASAVATSTAAEIDPRFRRVGRKQTPTIYYLGSGYRFFKIDKRGIHIGNQSTGWIVDQIYFNFMLLYTPRK
jgi:hypothetical protein